MYDSQSLSHTQWDCKYHIVWIPKCRSKVLYGKVRAEQGKFFRELARQRECVVIEVHLCPDHVHIYMTVPPKYAVSQVVGYIKGESAIYIARTFGGRSRNFTGENFWARGYYVSTVGRDEQVIREYIRQQESEDQRSFWGQA